MSIIYGLPLIECIYRLACARWAWKRFLHTAGHDSETWGLATAEEFEHVSRLCCYILTVYEDDLRHPFWEPPRGYGINPDWLILKKTSFSLVYYPKALGHSLGLGIAAMLALVVVQHQDELDNIDRRSIRFYAIAPARCMSLNLAVRYTDVISSVVLQASWFFNLMLGFIVC
ncbi:hypothetical protein PTKIN_Ptkin05aG0110400 [Pterospermum kingtungense]